MKNELKILLKMLPIRILREIAYKKKIKVKTRQKEAIIEALVEKGEFDEKEIKDLRELVKILAEESEPVSQYILRFSKIDLSNLKSKLGVYQHNLAIQVSCHPRAMRFLSTKMASC